MSDTRHLPNDTESSSPATDPVVEIFDLGFPWATFDPFLVTVHHLDHYPEADDRMAPATPVGMRDQSSAPSTGGWSMYYGDVVPGFPQHPHRGFETVTIVRRGFVDHSDSMGATARYGAGDIQWLTAGQGIQHTEMFPLLNREGPNTLELFQIWLNLPGADKMVEPYFTMMWREEVPRTTVKDHAGHSVDVSVIAGAFGDVAPLPPPPDSWASKPEADLAIWQFLAEPSASWELPPASTAGVTRALYVFEGDVEIGGHRLQAPIGALLAPEEETPVLTAGDAGASVLILQARPIGEPVAMGGPFVMNQQVEIEQAYRDFRQSGFGGWPWSSDRPVHPSASGRFARRPDGREETPE